MDPALADSGPWAPLPSYPPGYEGKMTGPTATSTAALGATLPHVLPRWGSVLAVVAHPDDESFGLGAVLDTLTTRGTAVSVLSLTHGEATTLHGVSGDLSELRAVELRRAAEALGLKDAQLRGFPDGQLDRVDRSRLVAQVDAAAREAAAEALVVFDPSGVSGHPDHTAATLAAVEAARALDLPVLAWTLPRAVADQLDEELDADFAGHDAQDIDVVLAVDRERQRIAALAHASQAVPTSVLWRRLELLGDQEHLRWLIPPTLQEPGVVVDWEEGDRFTITVGGHRIVVDQPLDVGGTDAGPTPTDLMLASLASCVAFYARRYLRRHHLDATGLTVTARHRMATHPNRVGDVDLLIHLPTELTPSRRAGLLAQAGHCTVHNTLVESPTIAISLGGAASEPA